MRDIRIFRGRFPVAAASRRLLTACACVVLALLPAAVTAADPAGVLILYSNQRPTPAQVIIEETLRTVIQDQANRPVQLYSEFLDDEWASLATYGQRQADFLRDKYRRRNIRVIVAVALPALQFMMQFRGAVAADVPVVHMAVALDRLQSMSLPPWIVGRAEDLDALPTLQMALQLHPGARRLVVVRGALERDSSWDRRVQSALQRLGPSLDVEYLAGLPTAEVLQRVAALPRGTLIYTPGYFVDGAGEVFTPRRVAEWIAAAASVPVYGTFATMIGSGVVGGYMTLYEDQAREAGETVVRLLAGTSPGEVAPASVRRVPMVDWRQVQRWNIDERLLPAGTIVEFREPGVWEKYRSEILAGVALLGLQAALIAALLLQRNSRRRTAVALEESQRQMTLATSAARLTLWSWQSDAGNRETATSSRSIGSASYPSTALDEVLRHAHPADRQRLQQAVDKALAGGQEFDLEYRVLDHQGDMRWIAARGRAPHGVAGRLVGVALDITERKANDLAVEHDRAALRQLSRVSMVGQLSAAIAHQLNQPLAAILGNAEAAQKMLGRDGVDLQELRAICDDIVAEDRRASEVIRRLRELYQRADMKMEQVHLNTLAQETLELLHTELQLRHVAVATLLAPGLPPVTGSPVQLQQVLMNLILNGIDALSSIDHERLLTLRTEAAHGEVCLAVSDNGPGIRPDELKMVFEPFWSTKSNGMGMGLSICQSIVAAHGGRIVAMNNPNRGATFLVVLRVGEVAA